MSALKAWIGRSVAAICEPLIPHIVKVRMLANAIPVQATSSRDGECLSCFQPIGVRERKELEEACGSASLHLELEVRADLQTRETSNERR